MEEAPTGKVIQAASSERSMAPGPAPCFMPVAACQFLAGLRRWQGEARLASSCSAQSRCGEEEPAGEEAGDHCPPPSGLSRACLDAALAFAKHETVSEATLPPALPVLELLACGGERWS